MKKGSQRFLNSDWWQFNSPTVIINFTIMFWISTITDISFSMSTRITLFMKWLKCFSICYICWCRSIISRHCLSFCNSISECQTYTLMDFIVRWTYRCFFFKITVIIIYDNLLLKSISSWFELGLVDENSKYDVARLTNLEKKRFSKLQWSY